MKNTKRNELAVCGFAAVKKLEKNHPEKITRLYFTEEVAPKFGGLCKKLAKQHGIYNQKPASELEWNGAPSGGCCHDSVARNHSSRQRNH